MDTVVKTPAVEPVKIQPKPFVGATVDTKEVRFDQLTTYIAGQAWDVDFFSLIRGRDDDARPFESDLHPVYQQYKLIKGFELKVTQDLQSTQANDTKDQTLSGSANVYGVLIPKEGDLFLADIGDGREGLFHVTSTTRMSHYMSAVYQIEYTMIKFSSAQTREDLVRKTVETVVFHKNFLDSGNTPLLSEEHTQLVNNMAEHYGRLITLYFHDFGIAKPCSCRTNLGLRMTRSWYGMLKPSSPPMTTH
jgi:hypothetical protein